ncbi:MAG: hypothetical protein IJZ30_06835 [Alphaproteobacteria bacterium]|nr:hypothetical protein [Alphaproteobacteria bacterium]
MSKGPFRASVINITHVDSYHKLTVKSDSTCLDDVIFISDNANIEVINIGDCIVYYLEEKDSSVNEDDRSKNIVVVIYKEFYSVSSHGLFPVLKSWYWIRKGEQILQLDKLPGIIEILFNLSRYYRNRKKLAQKAIDILNTTQDVEALDALFSMHPCTLYEVLSDRVCLDDYETICSVDEKVRKQTINDAFIPVQIADLLVNLKANGADIENPHKRDLFQITAMAITHGEKPKDVHDFISSYERKV